MKPTNEQITAAARALSNDNADVCNVNREDNWNIYGDSFRETARVALEAAFNVSALAVDAGARDEREAFDVALDALSDYQNNWDTGLAQPYAESERIAMECAVEAVREALNEARAALSASTEAAAGEPVAQWKDPTKELVAKYWTPSEIGNTLTNVTQILDVVRQEWSAQGCWSEWDQSVRDDITSALRAINTAPPAASGQKLTDAELEDKLLKIGFDLKYINTKLQWQVVGGLHHFRALLRASDSATTSDKEVA